jgi:UDP-N-acetylmuramate--alanine ligase
MTRRVHLVGIGGAGLSAIARVLLERGEIVTGSDQANSPYVEGLTAAGVVVTIGHSAAAVEGADLVIASSAIPADNVELVAAAEAQIPVVRRPAFLGELVDNLQTVAVAGTHGKTTTTAMIAWILEQAGLQPGFIVGGIPSDLGVNARHGEGEHFVIEADEYDQTFLGLHPQQAVVTNVEHDHPDHYPTAEAFREAFEQFVAQVSGLLIVCADDPGALALAHANRLTYGLSETADWRAEELRENSAGGLDFLVLHGEELLGLIRLRVPGEHNVRNALAALAVAHQLEIPFGDARSALAEFHGVGRRFELVGQVGEVTVIDDYAHHPSEVRATLAAARQRYPEATLWAVFQPHTYSRTKAFIAALAGSFADADHVIVTDIFAAREAPDPEISGQLLAERIASTNAQYIASLDAVVDTLLRDVEPGSVVLILSAGDADRVGRELVAGLESANKGELHG